MKRREPCIDARGPLRDLNFRVGRLGEIMRPEAGAAHEAWGVLNPGGVRAPDGTMHLFPRLIAEGNHSRIGQARVIYDEDVPARVERLGIALEPDRGWLLTYHGVAASNGRARHCMGVAILDLDRPSRVLSRSPLPILEPEADHECRGLVSNVVFPSAIDVRPEGNLDVYYGAADHVIAAARLRLPKELRTAAPAVA